MHVCGTHVYREPVEALYLDPNMRLRENWACWLRGMAVASDQLTIVIPTLNKEEGVGIVLQELKEH